MVESVMLLQARSRVRVLPILVYKYVDQKGLAAMRTAKRSAGVTPEVTLVPRQRWIWGIRCTNLFWKPGQTGVSVVPQKYLCPPKYTAKKDLINDDAMTKAQCKAPVWEPFLQRRASVASTSGPSSSTESFHVRLVSPEFLSNSNGRSNLEKQISNNLVFCKDNEF